MVSLTKKRGAETVQIHSVFSSSQVSLQKMGIIFLPRSERDEFRKEKVNLTQITLLLMTLKALQW